MHVLFNLECLVFGLHVQADEDIERFSSLSSLFIILVVYSELRIVSVLHPTTFVVLIEFLVYTSSQEVFIEFFHQVELTSQVYHRTSFTLLVDHVESRDTSSLGYEGVVRTECRSDVYDTCTVFSSYIITRDHTECLSRCISPVTLFVHAHRLHPWEELFVFHAYEVSTLVLAYYLERNEFVARLVVFECEFSSLRVEVHVEERLRQYHSHLFARVSVVCLYGYIVNLRTHTECHV